MADVLICDTDPGSLQVLEAVLKAEGCQVESFSHLSEAVVPCLRRKYKVAVLSLGHRDWLETEDRLEPLRIIRKLDPDIPLVVVSDQEDLETERKLRTIGIFYLLTRPVSFEELRAVVRSAIDKRGKTLKPEE